jgi:hypothetical protein
MTNADSNREAENIANVKVSKISAWAKDNKIIFNEQKSKVMLWARRKRKEEKEIEMYLNNKLLLQVHSLKYLGIIFDSKLSCMYVCIYIYVCVCVCVCVYETAV